MKVGNAMGAILISIVAAGCASAPVRYYSLAATPGAMPAIAAADCCRITIKNVSLPPAVDRPEIVVRLSEDQMLVLSNDLWIAPLRDEMRAALASSVRANLASSGGNDIRASQGDLPVIQIEVERFEAVDAQYALVQTAWRLTLRRAPHDLTAACESSSKVSVAEGVAALVRGYQQAIDNIGAQIAMGLRNLADGKTACGKE